MQGASGLFGSAILEAAIGLAFLYFIMSVVCSSVSELVASVFLWRAKDLEKALLDLLGEGGLFQNVTSHPLVTAMGHNEGGSKQQPSGGAQDAAPQAGDSPPATTPTIAGRPAYLPSRTFALALLDSVVNSKPAESRKEVNLDNLKVGISGLLAGNAAEMRVGKALSTLLEDSRDPRGVATRIDVLKMAISKLPVADVDQSKLRLAHLALLPLNDLDAMQTVIDDTLGFDPPLQACALQLVGNTKHEIQTAAYSIDRLQTNVETWYDNAMDRMTGFYKRHIQLFLLAIGFVITVATGADTLHFATTLFANPTVRGELANTATTAAQQAQPPSPTVGQAVDVLAPFSLLFGYDDVRQLQLAQSNPTAPRSAEQMSPILFWIEKIAGLAITAFAIMLGGPFWFQILQKLVNLRGTGPKPERSAASASAPAASPAAAVAVVR